MVTVSEAGRRGGLSRSRSLTSERKRAIALAASRAAAAKRYGMPTERELVKVYIARLRDENPDLALFVELALQAPAKYAPALAGLLAAEEQDLATRSFEEAVSEAQTG